MPFFWHILLQMLFRLKEKPYICIVFHCNDITNRTLIIKSIKV